MTRILLLPLALLLGCDPADDMPVPGDPDFERDPALDIELVSAHGGDASHYDG